MDDQEVYPKLAVTTDKEQGWLMVKLGSSNYELPSTQRNTKLCIIKVGKFVTQFVLRILLMKLYN